MVRTRVCVMAILIVSALTAARAQAPTGSLTGLVVDASNAPVKDASVDLSGPTHASTRTAADGHFTISGVPTGTYDIGIGYVGFAQQRRAGVAIGAGTTQLPDVVLAVGSVSDTVVVTASRTMTALVDAPATMSVVDGATLATAAARNYGDLLRAVPGVNVIQLSARDMNLTSRQATSTLANSQLVLLDGRPVNLDFFGMVLWDYLPNNMSDIKHIEVIRGPASAVWGAGALTGVVNVITKSPRETPGVDVEMSAGFINRGIGSTTDKGLGGVGGSSATVSRAVDARWSYRVSAGYFASSAFPRPTGSIPVITDPRDSSRTVGGAVYPADTTGSIGSAFVNRGTSQPKFDVRVDREMARGGRMSYEAGVAGTEGLIHTAVGPFDIQPGSYMSYARVSYERQGLQVSGFANVLDASAPNLLLLDPRTSRPLELDFSPKTFDVELRDVRPISAKHVLSYGGNVRRNVFNLTIAPAAKNRTELGGYLEDTIFLKRALLTAGARVDKFGNLDHAVFSPRLALTFKPSPEQAIRVSYNRAFRSPSVVNNYLDATVLTPVDLSSLQPLVPESLRPPLAAPFPLAIRAIGSELSIGSMVQTPLKEERANSYELAYTGTIRDRTTLGASVYVTDLKGVVGLALLPFDLDPYTVDNPPPGWMLPASTIGLLASQGIYLPRTVFSYLNLGPVRDKGIELSVDHRVSASLSTFANYSWQATPTILKDPRPYPTEELQMPPASRVNAGVSFNGSRYLGSASVNASTRAFWSDVLTPAYHGYTAGYGLLNATAGRKWNHGKLTTLVKITNLLNQNAQQHIFGDILKRTVTFEARIHY